MRIVGTVVVSVALLAIALVGYRLYGDYRRQADATGVERNSAVEPKKHAEIVGAGQVGRLASPAKASSLSTVALVELEGRSIEELIRRANEGDSRAGCRAARQLYDCAVLAEVPVEALSNGLSRTELALSASRDNSSANEWAHVQLAMFDASQRCKAVSPELQKSMAGILRSAALAGNRAAMLKYGSGEFLGLSPGLEATRHPEYERWKAEAQPMVLQSLRAGSLEAAFALWNAYRSDDGALEGIVPNDPVEAHVYKFLLHLAKGERPGTMVRLTRAQHDEALRRATKLHEEIFSGGLAQPEEAVLGPSWLNAGEEVVREPCMGP